MSVFNAGRVRNVRLFCGSKERIRMSEIVVDLIREESCSVGTYKPSSFEERVEHMVAKGANTVAPKGKMGGVRKGREGVIIKPIMCQKPHLRL